MDIVYSIEQAPSLKKISTSTFYKHGQYFIQCATLRITFVNKSYSLFHVLIIYSELHTVLHNKKGSGTILL